MDFLTTLLQILSMCAGVALAWVLFDWMPKRTKRRREAETAARIEQHQRAERIAKAAQAGVQRHEEMQRRNAQLRAMDRARAAQPAEKSAWGMQSTRPAPEVYELNANSAERAREGEGA